jgi:hypothetical protein
MAILQATSVNGVLAVAATIIILTGGIDLSIGTLMTFCAVITGVVLTWAGMPLPLGILAAIGTGALCGLASGTFVAQMKIPPFIATLGMMLMLKGLSLIITGARPIYFNDTPGYTDISQGSLIGMVFPALPIPNGVLVLFVVAGGMAWVLSRTVLGRYTYALGSNEEAVRLSGVNTRAWKNGCLCARRRHLWHRRHPHFRASQLGAAGPWPWLRAGRHCRRCDWRHVARRGQRHGAWHADWRTDHGRAHQWPAYSFGRARVADRCDRRDHHPCRLCRSTAEGAQLRSGKKRAQMPRYL